MKYEVKTRDYAIFGIKELQYAVQIYETGQVIPLYLNPKLKCLEAEILLLNNIK